VNLKILFNRPEYIFRPSQLLRRLSMLIKRKKNDFISIKLPWGVEIKVHFEDVIGRSICNSGIYDMPTT